MTSRREHRAAPGAYLALDHAAGRLEDAAYLERLRALRESKESLETTASGSAPRS